MRKCIVNWDDNNNTWRCSYYDMCRGVDFSESREKCYHYRCPGRHARVQIVLPEQQTESIRICSEEGCNNPVATNRREHCSERCRKRMNGRAYRERKKKIKNGLSSVQTY